jgi:hypothetical protein
MKIFSQKLAQGQNKPAQGKAKRRSPLSAALGTRAGKAKL